jgi:EAL domain-containing protein (putative c-di-GMP-specific phosphodiesterase class I)
VAGFEALVRWEHPERALINADQFVPVAQGYRFSKPPSEDGVDALLAPG